MGVRNYLSYRRHGFGRRLSFELAFGRALTDVLLKTLYYTAAIVTMTWLLTSVANALVIEHDARNAQSKQYTANLERTLATCLSRGDNPIMIGDELWMCGASYAGDFGGKAR